MPSKVTLWKASNGMHYSTEADADIAEAQAELDAFLTSQPGGGDPAFRAAFVRLALGVWSGPPQSREEMEAPQAMDANGDGKPTRARPEERGADVFARYAATLKKRAASITAERGSEKEARLAGKVPEPAQVSQPVRRRSIREHAPQPEPD